MPTEAGSIRPDRSRLTLRREQRLTKSAEIREAYSQQRKTVGKYMVLWRREADNANLRLAVVASKKVGGAVQRNRAKRRLREVFRLNQHQLSGPCDVVLVARKSILTASWPQVVEDFSSVFKRAGLLSQPLSQ